MTVNPPAVTISAVTISATSSDELEGFGLGFPEPGSSETVYSFPIQGWAVGRHSPARSVEVLGAQRRLPRLAVSIPRPDIGSRWPEVPWSGECGFAARLGVVHLPRSFGLELSLLLDSGARVGLGVIEGARRPLPTKDEAQFQPLMVTTLGRSGSTWLTWLLGKHPELMDYRSFEYEPRVTGYFTEMLRALTQPASYFQTLRGDIDAGEWWLGRNPNQGLPWYSSEPTVDDWLGSNYVEDLITFFFGRVDALYRRLAEASHKNQALYFIEKFPPVFFAQRMLWEIYPGAKEVFLVRDPRDLACSVFAFGDKRGLPWYRVDPPTSIEETLRERIGDEVAHLLSSWRERSADAHLLRYEDLILNPEETLSALFSYLAVDGSAQTIDRLIKAAAELHPRRQADHMTSADPRASVGRWRTELDPSLRQASEEALGEALAAFGYS